MRRIGKKNKIHPSEYTKGIHKLFDKLAYRHSLWSLFSDFLLISACSISNSVDNFNQEEREKQYLETVEKYTAEEFKLFVQILDELVEVMEHSAQERSLQDFLGRLFHELNLHNERRGQFFTPQNISDMMALMIMGDSIPEVNEHGFVTVCEPTCGSGVMAISAAKAIQNAGHNYSSQMVIDCTDIDISCVHMCYIQLSLYGIPAVVRHGNSLTMEVWSNWYTPIFIADGWPWRYGK